MVPVEVRNIEKVAERCGGRAVIAGTRIRVSVVLACYRQGMTVEEIVQQYPHLRPADVHDALAYAYHHAEEIDADLAADDEAAAQQQWPGGEAMSQMRFFLDEDVHAGVATSLRTASFDALSTPEVNRLGESDSAQLHWAASEGRVLVSFNVSDFARLHHEWLGLARHHAGVSCRGSGAWATRSDACCISVKP